MVVASFILGILAVVIAGAAALITRSQVVEMRNQFRDSGPRIGVSSYRGVSLVDVSASVYIVITATNFGRGSANIKAWGLFLERDLGDAGLIIGPLQGNIFGPPTPLVINGLDSANWGVEASLVDGEVSRAGYQAVRPFVDLGDGSRVYGVSII